MERRWTLVGRDQELAVIDTALSRGGVVVAGSAGVGKSRLAAEALARAEATGRPIGRCAATASARSVPFGAMMHLLADTSARPALDLTTLFSIACDQVATRLDGGVLMVDDAHLLDDPSAATIHQLARAGNVALLIVVRTPHQTPTAIDAIWKDEVLPRLDLQPLSRSEMRTLLEHECGGPVSDHSVARLHTVTSGNPLFLRELVVEARATGALELREGVWWWSGVVSGTPRLVTVVEQAASRLSAESRRVLELLALIEPLPVEVIEDVLGPSTLSEALRERVVEVGGDHQVCLRHPLWGEVARSAIDASSQQRLVRSISSSIMSRPASTGILRTQLAVLHLRSGVSAPSDLLAAAAAHVALTGDPGLGQQLARAALAVDPNSFDARLALGRSLFLVSEHSAAEAEYVQVVGREPSDAAIAMLAYARMGALVFSGTAVPGQARDMVCHARDRVLDQRWKAMLDGVLAEIALNDSDLDTARRIAADVLANTATAPEAQLQAAHMLSLGETLSGHGRRGAEIAQTYWPLAREHADANPVARGWMLLDRFLGMSHAGPLDEAFDFCDWLTSDSEPTMPAFEGSAFFFHGRLHLLAGRPATAERWLRQAVGSLRTHDPRAYLHWALGALAAACALQGDVAAATEALEMSSQGGASSARRLFDADRLLLSCWVLAAGGQISAAVKQAEAIGAIAVARGQLAFGVLALHDAMRLGSLVAPATLIEAAAGCDTLIAAAYGRHASALLDGDADELVACAASFRDLGLVVCAAETSIEACQRLKDLGRAASARAASATATAILHDCEGIRTPIIERHVRLDVRLTPREEEIVQRAAHGISNRQIADELYTSVRTVEGHLLRAFAKLGITKRSELSSVLALPTDRQPS